MSVDFDIANKDGKSGTVSANYIMGQVKQAGMNPQGMSADGMSMTLQDSKGSYEIPTTKAIENLGWQVQKMTPQNADYSAVQPAWRAAVHGLPNDKMRAAYIKGSLEDLGHKDPKVIGSGRDWYGWDPESNRYVALTNSPDWGAGDLAEGGMDAARAVGAGLGGATGALGGLGVASIPGAIGGAAAGGAGVDLAERGALAAFDPRYRQVAGDSMHDMAMDVGKNAALDGVTQGAAKAIPLAAKAVSPAIGGALGKFMDNGAMSSAARGAGHVADKVGGAVNAAGKWMDGSVGHDFVGGLLPGGAEAQTAQFVAKAPGWLATKSAEGLHAVADSSLAKKYAPNVSSNLRDYVQRMSRAGTIAPSVDETVTKATGKFANAMKVEPEQMAEESAYSTRPSTLGENFGRDIGQKAAMAPSYVKAKAATMANSFGKSSFANSIDDVGAANLRKGARRAYTQAGHDAWDAVDTARDWGEAGAKIGRSMGRGAEHLSDLGDVAGGAAKLGGKAVIKGARYGGAATQYGGRALKYGGTLTAPLENRALMRYGAEEAYGHDLERPSPLRKKKPQATMDPVLANN